MILSELSDADLELLAAEVAAERARRARSRRCRSCGEGFVGRADARFCSTRCRVQWSRTRGVPVELRSRHRWVQWANRSGRKVPISATGHPASSTDPLSWASFDRVRSTLQDGFGFVLNGDGIGCVDLDSVLEGGVLDPRAKEFLATLDPFFVEVSPSGRGLHAWVWGGSPDGRVVYKLENGLKVEWYTTERFMTVTGNRWEG